MPSGRRRESIHCSCTLLTFVAENDVIERRAGWLSRRLFFCCGNEADDVFTVGRHAVSGVIVVDNANASFDRASSAWYCVCKEELLYN